MAAVNVDGMLLAAGTSELPPSVAYAYVVHSDYPDGMPLVEDGYRHRAVELGAKGNIPAKKATPNGPKLVGKEWLPAPLALGWFINPVTLLYEKRNADGVVITTSLHRPAPYAAATLKKMAVVQRLRREFELSILQPAGRRDSDSYLSYKEVKQRDLEFNALFGFELNHGWLAVSKDVPEDAHLAEGDSAFTAWELADALKSDLEAGADSRKCLDRAGYWKCMGGGILADESYVSAAGNHAPLSKWYQGTLHAQAQDAHEVFEWVGARVFSIKNGIGVFEVADSVADPEVLCLELVARAPGGGSQKVDKESSVAGAPLLKSIRDLFLAMVPLESFSSEARAPPAGTPESLKHGLRLIADQIQIARPKKRKAVSATNIKMAENAAMRRIITLKTFEAAVAPLRDEGGLMELAESFVGHDTAVIFYETAFAPNTGGSINSASKKVFANSLFEAFKLAEEAR